MSPDSGTIPEHRPERESGPGSLLAGVDITLNIHFIKRHFHKSSLIIAPIPGTDPFLWPWAALLLVIKQETEYWPDSRLYVLFLQSHTNTQHKYHCKQKIS